MATEIVHTIKATGGDYTSLSAWEAAQQRDLVAADEIAIAECYPFQDTTVVTVDGWVADTSHPIIMRTPLQHRPKTTWDTNAYRLYISNPGPDHALQISESDVIVDGLQIQGAYGTTFERNGINIGGQVSGSVIVKNNNIVGNIVTYACYGIYYNKGSAPGNQIALIYNNVIFGWMNPGGVNGNSVGIFMNQYGFQHVFNNTIVSCSIGLRATSAASTISASNNLVYLCNTASFGTFDFTSNNATDSSSITGSNSRVNQTFTFESGSYRLSTFDRGARTFGTNLSAIPTGSFTTDFDGNIRRRNWDIGAFQNNEQRIGIGTDGTKQITGSAVKIFMDEFNRANGNLGNEYQVYPLSSSFNIFNNQARGGSIISRSLAVLTGSRFSDDHEATVVYSVINSFDFAGPAVRGNAQLGTGYILHLDGVTPGRIHRMNSQSITQIGTVTVSPKAGQRVSLRAVGNAISVYLNNQFVDSVVDSTYPTGQPGMYYRWENSRITTLDNFVATDIPPQGKIGQLMTITPT